MKPRRAAGSESAGNWTRDGAGHQVPVVRRAALGAVQGLRNDVTVVTIVTGTVTVRPAAPGPLPSQP